MKRITLLEVVSCLGIGGIERAMQEFCLSIDKKRFRVIAAVYRPEGPRRAILEKAGITVVPVTDASLAHVVRKYGVDVVHAHTIKVSHLIPKGIPVVQEVVFSGGYDQDATINLIISKALAAKTKTVFPSLQYGADYRVLYYPQNVVAWDALRHPDSVREHVRKRLGFTSSHVVFGRVGRSEPSKTDYLLIASAPRIAKRVPQARFLFVGLPWLYRQWLALKPSLRGKMVFLSETPDDSDLALFYQSIDVFWHTASRGETFGNVNAEAMTFQKPVITHSTPFTGGSLGEHIDNAQIEIIDHGVTGFVANDPVSVAEAARRLATDSRLRERMGRAARAKVEKLYDARVVVRDFEMIIQHVVTGSGDFPTVPSRADVEQFIAHEYHRRCSAAIVSGSRASRSRYRCVRRWFYMPIEFCYLVARKIARMVLRFNIESYGSFKPWSFLR